MGSDIIINNYAGGNYTKHIRFISTLVKSRTYPGSVGDLFRNAVAISDTARMSVAQK